MAREVTLYVDSSSMSRQLLRVVEPYKQHLTITTVTLTKQEVERQRCSIPCLLAQGALIGPTRIEPYLQDLLGYSVDDGATA